MQAPVSMAGAMASPCGAFGTSPDRLFASPPSVRIPKRLQTATAYAYLLSRLYFSARWSIRAWHLDFRDIKAARDHKHLYDSSLCAGIIELSSLPATPIRPGSDIVSPAPLARGGRVDSDRVSVESRATAQALAAVAAQAQEAADASAASLRVAADTTAAMQRYNDSRGSSSGSSGSSEDRYSRRHRRSKPVGSKENRTFVIGCSDHKAWYDTLVPYLRGLHTKVSGDGGAAELSEAESQYPQVRRGRVLVQG